VTNKLTIPLIARSSLSLLSAQEYLTHLNSPENNRGSAGRNPNDESESESESGPTSVGLALLEKVTDRVPALLEAHLVNAKAR